LRRLLAILDVLYSGVSHEQVPEPVDDQGCANDSALGHDKGLANGVQVLKDDVFFFPREKAYITISYKEALNFLGSQYPDFPSSVLDRIA
jgi:hypothetical protein